MDQDQSIPLSFTHEGVEYTGWATASRKAGEDGFPKSFRVVLNKVFFGNLSANESSWTNDEQRPEGLTETVGKILSSKRKKI
ncbi:hypothetical protein [Foetidibacter luteolus]|uniref:hypothetical protein n=1 Tax=Foetidibacter luteolus TaxID=2608880 RepID=UPI00129B2BCC|nr:hypothetical protein [Foetidibacter luteolus]